MLDLVLSNEAVFYPELFATDPESCQLWLETIFQGLKDEPAHQKLALAHI